MDADTLRLILSVAGGLLLIGLYLRERQRGHPDEEKPYPDDLPADEDKREPRLGAWTDEAGDKVGDVPASGDHQEESEPPLGPGEPEIWPEVPEVPETRSEVSDEPGPVRPKTPMILLLHITPIDGIFDGEAIVHAASRCGVEPGEQDIFHRYTAPGSTEHPLFSMANMVNPGTFPFGAMADFESPGLTLFSQAEGASDDPPRLETMLTTAHCLATALKAEIRDETRDPLTPEAEERLRDRVDELVAWRLADADSQ